MDAFDTDDIIELAGGCGRFQVLLTFIVHSMKCVVCFSMVFMMFGMAKTDWWCTDGLSPNITLTTNLSEYKRCHVIVENETRLCTEFTFADDMKTVATQWSLVCDHRDWIPTTITSMQMAGVLIGNLACGQMADLVGRKPPLFLALLSLVVLNIIAAFSVSWIMFAVLRLLMGIAMGFQLTVQYNMTSEFTQTKWRSWVIAIPSWSIQMTLFALVTWLVKDWRWVHIVTAAIGIPLLLTFRFVPESFRWHIGHDRIHKAREIIRQIARFNRKPVPEINMFKSIKETPSDEVSDGDSTASDRKYTILDLVKDNRLLRLTILFAFVWFSLGLGNYGMQFGVERLTGNLFINMFLLSLIGSPSQFATIFLLNCLGRKRTAILFYLIASLMAIVKATTELFEDGEINSWVGRISAMVAMCAFGTIWSPIQTLTVETYPTVVRNIGYGTLNTMSRIGAIIGPQLAFLDTKLSGILYWIAATVSLLSIFLLYPVPETRGSDLKDKIQSDNTVEMKNEEVI